MLRRPRAGEGGDSKSHANEKSSVDISLGGEGACDGLKLGGQRGSLVYQLRPNSNYIHRTKNTFQPSPFCSCLFGHWNAAFASASIRFHKLFYSIVFYSANKAPLPF